MTSQYYYDATVQTSGPIKRFASLENTSKVITLVKVITFITLVKLVWLITLAS